MQETRSAASALGNCCSHVDRKLAGRHTQTTSQDSIEVYHRQQRSWIGELPSGRARLITNGHGTVISKG